MYANVTGTPCSCIASTSPSVFFASAPSNPGKPHCPNWSVMFDPSVALTQPFTPPIAGLTYFAPNRPWKPLSEPGSTVAGSGRAFVLLLHGEVPFAQWIAIPTRSVCASVRAAPAGANWEAFASFHASEPSPNSDVTSPAGSVAYTLAPAGWAVASGVATVIPVPVAPHVPIAVVFEVS